MTGNQVMAAIGKVMEYVSAIVGWAFVLLVAAKVLQIYGARLPLLPVIDHMTLVYVAGAWWLVRK